MKPNFFSDLSGCFLKGIYFPTFGTLQNQSVMWMIIADSGSTKTTWCLLDTETGDREIRQTPGINPFYQGEEEIISMLEKEFAKLDTAPDYLFFYGAGCANPTVNEVLYSALGCFFQTPVIDVQPDIMAAARSLCGREAGIACILGTGSNSCYYDGVSIVENVSPLGFLLGDEGSGGVLGKRLLADVLKKQLSEPVINRFFASGITRDEIMENIYRKPFPNRYAAQFARFIYENREEPELKSMVIKEFDAFLTRNVLQYPRARALKIHFTGSVAWYFRDFLKESATSLGLVVGNVMQEPMDGLVDYHFKNLQ